MTDCKFKTLLGAFAVTVALCASSFGAPATAADKIAAFTRNAKWQNMLVVVNTRNESVDATVDFNADAMTTALSYGASYKQVDGRLNVKLAPYGYLVIRYE